ncbi:restriction endonuclease subunit S [Streptococcus infantis]|uniref:restriction endonuclease subunit S n=1 Tax=Streptococcus infantis TaxID=68892 RepID=UPI0039C10976
MLQNKVPNVRFCKYLDIWKTTKLNRITEIIGGGTPDTKQFSYWNGGINWFSPTEVGKTVYLTKSEKTISQLGLQKSSAKLLPAFKTILFTSRAGIGDVGILTEESATNQGFQSLVVNEETDVYFLYSYSDQIKKYALKHSAGSTFLEISGKELGKMDLSIPSLPEQQAIGSFFRTLDDLLTSYKDNLANYQSLKATMLSKMFPKAGQTVPEIRLDGFEEEWELLEINDLADDFQSGGTPKTNVQEYWDGDIPWIQSSDLETNCLFKIKVQKSISEKGLKNSSAKIIPKDSIAVVTRVGVGKLAVMRHEYATSQDFLSLSNLKSNIEFTAYLLYRLLQKEVTQLQGTSIKGITKGELLSKKVLIPSLPEQQAIGAYFSNLDNLINSHQEKIIQLETLKKKLLQDMFI